ncbi:MULTISPECIES: hypothetical protein [unclassified Sphingobacterium]|uniref:hypothetical protein n=1 Tax=unclassified Sphingobacterium TaxID=2609468 RepID=UPI00104B3088|nr:MULTISPECIES: hypothetical protein [unclassified Sphingobacterium]MCS3556607.1 hypothetical protein [Sphingobacterium sp. JUb21]TCQ99899.1 hypothetical protein EDF66_113124 [Sphingobacterium sp. JUb20]
MNNTLNTWGFALFSSHLHHFIPDIAWEQHIVIFQEWQHYHSPKNKLLDLQSMRLSDQIDWYGLPAGILVLFHLGDHLFWPQKLADEGIAFDLVMDRAVWEKNTAVLTALQRKCTVNGAKCCYFFSDDPMLIFKIKASLKQHRHVLIFADGTSAASAVDKRVEVDFLAGKLAVKPGIAVISYLLKCPIYALHSHMIEDVLILDLMHISLPNTPISRESYVMQTMQSLFAGFAAVMQQQPYRWECWGYLHRNGMWNPKNVNLSEDEKILVHFVKLPIQDGWAYFDRVNYMLYH